MLTTAMAFRKFVLIVQCVSDFTSRNVPSAGLSVQFQRPECPLTQRQREMHNLNIIQYFNTALILILYIGG
jgi:hypothetical protein